MFKFFKKLFRKSSPPPQPVPIPRAIPELAYPLGRVEVASLSLAAILSRFPADLKENISNQPDEAAMVALPLSTILKQLPSGSVKMSLASIYRQSPSGTFHTPRMEEKRLVEVPLGEIFKRVKPDLLKRRDDQRMNTLAEEDGIDVFGSPANPYMVAPVEAAPVSVLPETIPPAASKPLTLPSSFPPLTLPSLVPPPPSSSATPSLTTTPPLVPPPLFMPEAPEEIRIIPEARAAEPALMRVVPPPPGFEMPASAAKAEPLPKAEETAAGNPLVLPLADISDQWPSEVKRELPSGVNATISLPFAEVSKGLAAGRVSFAWAQIRSWTDPAIPASALLSEDLPLQLPLRVVAPAFLRLSKESPARKRLAIDETIPALFEGSASSPIPEPAFATGSETAAPIEAKDQPPAESKAEPIAEPAPAMVEPAKTAEEEPQTKLDGEPDPEPAAVVEAGSEANSQPVAIVTGEGEKQADEPVPVLNLAHAAPETLLESRPEPELEKAGGEQQTITAASDNTASDTAPVARTLGDIFAQPGKEDWSPAEIVMNTCRLLNIEGALVSLQEGLVVAHSLPERLKGEDVAAFLPQLFTRLNQYSDEMKLGTLDDLLMRTHGAEFQVYRLGVVFFAVLGKPGQNLPRRELELIAAELARQTQK